MFKYKNNKGFTLIEVIAVLVILGIITVMAVPSMIGFANAGRRVSNNNIARSIYIVAQGELSNIKRMSGLDEFIKEVAKNEYKAPNSDTDTENNADVYYILSTKGITIKDEKNKVMELIGKNVMDKEVLDDSISIEFNVKTGIVRGVYYSPNLTLQYGKNGADDIKAHRAGTDEIGYYGVDTTGKLPVKNLDAFINIYDGVKKPLDMDGDGSDVEENVLYVEMLLPKQLSEDGSTYEDVAEDFDVDILAKNGGTALYSTTLKDLSDSTNGHIFREVRGAVENDGFDITSSYKKYIWVLDIFAETHNTFERQRNSIAVKYPDIKGDIKARLTRKDTASDNYMSAYSANAYYDGTTGSLRTVNLLKSARHLNNVRYGDRTADYRQGARIDLKSIPMAPLTYHYDETTGALNIKESPFLGQYSALKSSSSQYTIENLNIINTKDGGKGRLALATMGLFGEVKGSILGVSVIKGIIDASDCKDVGTIAGILNGGSIKQSNSYSNLTVSGAENIGGLLGKIETGSVSESYNGGFYKAASSNEQGFGFVNADKGNIGGIAGSNKGAIFSCYNNARVNVLSVKVSMTDADKYLSKEPKFYTLTAVSNIGGIVGNNAGMVENTYATNHLGIYTSPTGCKSGGIVGSGTAATKSFHIANGTSDGMNISKTELGKSSSFGNLFAQGKGYPTVTPRDTKSDNYPYPTLKSNVHSTPWEDIKEIANASAELLYYEMYSDGTIKYYNGVDTIKPIDKGDERLVNNDGYSLDMEYANEYRITIGDKKYTLTDTANNTKNPSWSWKSLAGGETPTNLPVSYVPDSEKADKIKYSLFLNNSLFDDLGNGIEPIKIQVKNSSDKRILLGSSDSNSLGVLETDVYFNPLYANAIWISQKPNLVPTQVSYLIRSARQLDNVDKALSKSFKQEMNIDFESYRKELEMGFTLDDIKLTGNKMTFKDSAVVEGTILGEYDGGNKFIKNVEAQNGLFEEIETGASVKSLALLASDFLGSENVGSIAAINSGTITLCEVSDVTVKGIGKVGGIVGYNTGIVDKVYFNSTFRDENIGVYASPITGESDVGGLVGSNNGTLTNAYTTAIGPKNKDDSTNNYPTVGGGKDAGAKVYFLQATGYNGNAKESPKQGTGKTTEELEKISLNGEWEAATIDSTKDTFDCKGKKYPFPKIKGLNHHYDWPILVTTFKYYEKYSDNTIGYFYYIDNDEPIDVLKYNPDLTVVEEGYLIDLTTTVNYDIKITGTSDVFLKDCKSVVFDKRRVIKLNNTDMENYVASANITPSGMKPIKISTSASSKPKFENDLFGKDTLGCVFFNPYFAKAIYLTSTSTEIPSAVKAFELRSPRHMMNVNKNISLKTYDYKQTISMNFANKEIDGRPNYLKDGVALPAIGRNVIADFTGSYDGGCYDGTTAIVNKDTKRTVGNRIYNLVMNVPNDTKNFKNNTGSAFGNTGTEAITGTQIKNLEFVDPQIRYKKDGMGGGIVANINYGTIDNVNVYNTEERQLFANSEGKVDAQFCKTADDEQTIVKNFKCGHTHGGIAGISYGKASKITNCIVGTNENEISEIYDNKTKISCYSSANKSGEHQFILMGGIVGGITEGAKIIACTNIATLEPNVDGYKGDISLHCLGGIVGRIGNSDRGQGREKTSYGYVYGCYNAGTVKLPVGYLGGIAGRTGGYVTGNIPSKIISCYNTGRVNVVTNEKTQKLEGVPYRQDGANLRMGGIGGETDLTDFINCYNIGYVSDLENKSNYSGAGSIFGLPTYGNINVEYCYSLKSDQLSPKTIFGSRLYGDASVNGIKSGDFYSKFGDFWEPRSKLRNNEVMTNQVYAGVAYPGLKIPSGQKPYPVFTNSAKTNGFYIYPQFIEQNVDNVEYSNPHITPFEYIDSIYETTLKYYEKYANDDNEENKENEEIRTYNLDLRQDPIDNLKNDKIVTEDGYFLEIGSKDGKYVLKINDKAFEGISPTENVLGSEKNGFVFTEEMIKAFEPRYNKIQLFSQSMDGEESDPINRLMGTTSTNGGTAGTDLYFDYAFPKEIKYAASSVDVKTLKPEKDAYLIRSPRHLSSIGALAKAEGNNTTNRLFKQELDLEFKQLYEKSIVEGNFKGNYDGDFKIMNKPTIFGEAGSNNIGLFENNKGTISRLQIVGAQYQSSNTSDLNMGVVTAKNEGTIEKVSVIDTSGLDDIKENPTLQTTYLGDGQNLGIIAGSNETNGNINDVYVVLNAATPIKTPNGTKHKLGGLVGKNAGKIDTSLYIAKAPNANPISGMNNGKITENVFYLSGTMNGNPYNRFDVGTTGGIAKSTPMLTQLRDNLLEWQSWGKVEKYPYPSLTGMAPPEKYPVVEGAIEYPIAYYEEYDEGAQDSSYGWYYSNQGDESKPLNETKKIIGTGYGIIIWAPNQDWTLGLNGEQVTIALTKIDGKNIFKLEDEQSNKKIIINGVELDSYWNPLFAKSIFKKDVVANQFAIRTAGQMQNINQIDDTTGLKFTLERDIDFADIPLSDSVIHKEFKGEFEGNEKTISNISINAGTSDNVGLFSTNSGTISNVILRSANITGKNNVGGIAGVNLENGKIANCKATSVVIQGSGINVGGIAGYNYGTIVGCAIADVGELNPISAYDFVGGIAGQNGENAVISSADVKNIALRVQQGVNFGPICGKNNNETANSVTGNSTGVACDFAKVMHYYLNLGTEILDGANEGTDIGYFTTGTINEYKDAVAVAENVIKDDPNTSTPAVLAAIGEIEKARQVLKSNKIVGINAIPTDNATVKIAVEKGIADKLVGDYSDRAIKGNTVTVNISDIKIAEGYSFGSITVKDENDVEIVTSETAQGESYSFIMPDTAVTITVEMAKKLNALEELQTNAAVIRDINFRPSFYGLSALSNIQLRPMEIKRKDLAEGRTTWAVAK